MALGCRGCRFNWRPRTHGSGVFWLAGCSGQMLLGSSCCLGGAAALEEEVGQLCEETNGLSITLRPQGSASSLLARRGGPASKPPCAEARDPDSSKQVSGCPVHRVDTRIFRNAGRQILG
jgi:hypothetical protein